MSKIDLCFPVLGGANPGRPRLSALFRRGTAVASSAPDRRLRHPSHPRPPTWRADVATHGTEPAGDSHRCGADRLLPAVGRQATVHFGSGIADRCPAGPLARPRPCAPQPARHHQASRRGGAAARGRRGGRSRRPPAKLAELGISAEAVLSLGKRRTLRIKDKEVVGYEVLVETLTAEESICLQEAGLGGRRHMGCGVFVPAACAELAHEAPEPAGKVA